MKVGMYYSNADVRVENKPVPEVGDNDILIQIVASGICGSDLMEWYRIKRAPLVLGHELTGLVVQTGKQVTQFKKGDRVFATHHVPCDACDYCRRGFSTACEVFHTQNNFQYGGFAEFVKVGGRSVKTGTLKLPDSVSFETGTFIEPLGTVVRGARALTLHADDRVAIFGSGLAGILFVKLARALGVEKITVCDLNEYRLEAAKKAGASRTISASQDVAAVIAQVNGDQPPTKVIICAGAKSAAETALQCVDRGGSVLFFAVPKPGETIAIDFNPYWRNDIKLLTSYGAAPRDNQEALELLASGRIAVEDMITHRFDLDHIQEAFATATQATGTLKVIVAP